MTSEIHETIVEQSNDGIFIAQDGTIVYTNRRLREMTGCEAGELQGSPKTRIIAPGDEETVRKYHAARLAGDSAPSTYEVDLQT